MGKSLEYLVFVISVFLLIIIIGRATAALLPRLKSPYVKMLISALTIVAVMQFAIGPILSQARIENTIVNSNTLVSMEKNQKFKKVVLAHAWPADTTTAWYPDLKEKLEAKGIEVVIPALPNPEESTAKDWVDHLRNVSESNSSETLLIGHSIGGTALLRMLESTDNQYAGLIMVSTAGFDLGYPALKDFFEGDFDYDKIKSNVKFTSTFYSPSDEVLAPDPIKHANEFLTNLNAKTIVLNDRGHFAPFNDCSEIPELLDEITVRGINR